MTSQTATFENHWLFTASPNQGRTGHPRPCRARLTASAADFSPRKAAAAWHQARAFASLRPDIGTGCSGFEADADQEGLCRLRPRRLGLDRLDDPKRRLESLDELTVAAAVKDLADEAAFGPEPAAGEVDRELDQVRHSRRRRGCAP